jgi:hypothetical protein
MDLAHPTEHAVVSDLDTTETTRVFQLPTSQSTILKFPKMMRHVYNFPTWYLPENLPLV